MKIIFFFLLVIFEYSCNLNGNSVPNQYHDYINSINPYKGEIITTEAKITAFLKEKRKETKSYTDYYLEPDPMQLANLSFNIYKTYEDTVEDAKLYYVSKYITNSDYNVKLAIKEMDRLYEESDLTKNLKKELNEIKIENKSVDPGFKKAFEEFLKSDLICFSYYKTIDNDIQLYFNTYRFFTVLLPKDFTMEDELYLHFMKKMKDSLKRLESNMKILFVETQKLKKNHKHVKRILNCQNSENMKNFINNYNKYKMTTKWEFKDYKEFVDY